MYSQLDDPSLLKTGAFIDGEFSAAVGGAEFTVCNPDTNDVLANVASVGSTETAAAIAAAEKALQMWRARPAIERADLLHAWHSKIVTHKSDLAKIISLEQGKPISEAIGEVDYGASYIRWFAEEARRVYGDVIPAISDNARLLTIKQAIGVVACITPWNFPNAMLARKIAPALAAGCTVVCKPANETPLSALALAELARRVGIPNGVINIVAGDTISIGSELTSNPAVRKLTFTGSTDVGKLLVKQCAATMKRTSMELGGNAPFIVFETADIDLAVEGLIANKFRNAGQTCVCTNRVLIQRGLAGRFAEKLAIAMTDLKLGGAFEEDVSLGPLISKKAADNVRDLVKDAQKHGANVQVVGSVPAARSGNYVAPCLITNAKREMRVFSEEIFGPIVAMFEFDSEEEAINLANDTPFGLAAYFYSQDISQIWRVGEAIDFGMVGVNDAVLSSETIPFGGVKESGQGREGSKYGLDDYLEIKHLKLGGMSL